MHPRQWVHDAAEEESKAPTWREDARVDDRQTRTPLTRRNPLAGAAVSAGIEQRQDPTARSRIDSIEHKRLPSLPLNTVFAANPLGQQRRFEYRQERHNYYQVDQPSQHSERDRVEFNDEHTTARSLHATSTHYAYPLRAESSRAHHYSELDASPTADVSRRRRAQTSAPPRKASLAFILDTNDGLISDERTETSIERMQLSDTSIQEDQDDISDNSSEHYDGRNSHRDRRSASPPAQSTSSRKSAIKKSRICKIDNCTRYVVNKGLCIGHGGGKRCAFAGCTSSAKNMGVCWKHGGSTKCTIEGCDNRAKSRGVCWSHGGGRKCKEDSCAKTAVSNGLCWAHGGGKRCIVDDCKKPAYERNGNLCALHKGTHAPSA